MLDTTGAPTLMEGTPDEIASFVKTLPPSRYQIQILGLSRQGATKSSLAEAIERAVSRTPEQILASREAILISSPKPREIPAGQTLEDLVAGQWPGQESDEEIEEALKRLS